MQISKIFDNSDSWLQHVRNVRGEDAVLLLTSTIPLYGPNTEFVLKKAINISNILLELKLDNETLCAGMLYPALQENMLTLEVILEQYGENNRKLLRDVMHMQSLGRLQNQSQSGHHVENLRKMLLAMVTDVRAVLIILAERLWLLRNAKELSSDEQIQLARETSEIYAPLANRLGVWQLKWEIEDLCLRYLDPNMYATIAKHLAAKRGEREIYLENCISLLSVILREHNITNFQITGRAKHINSIYKKMQRKNAPITEIYDITAVRILVPEIVDCYTVLSTLQGKWEQIHNEFDDYISRPKANGGF